MPLYLLIARDSSLFAHSHAMSIASLPVSVALVPVLVVVYAVYSYFANPLRRVPAAHPLSHFTSLWIHWVRWRHVENATLKDAHARLGPIVCLGPDEISVNCVTGGIRDVYAGGFEKGNGKYNWYEFFQNYDGVPNMFSLAGNKMHSVRKRMLSNVYSKSVVTSSPALLAQMSTILCERFLPHLDTVASSEAPVLNIYATLSAATMDVVTGYIFGLKASSDLLSNSQQLSWFLDLYNSRRSFNFWGQEFPGLTSALRKYLGHRLTPNFVDVANDQIEKWTLGMCDGAETVCRQPDVAVEDTPSVYQQLASALSKEAKKVGDEKTDPKYAIASELLDHLAAGFDTSGITLTYIIHELSLHKDVQSNLRQELLTLSPPLVPSKAATIPNPKAVDGLPYLHAVIWETLRLHSAIPGPQPRFTPPKGCKLGSDGQSYYIPGGVRVSASAGLLHQNPVVYEQPEEWLPERWLDVLDEEKRKDMESRWFWAFGRSVRSRHKTRAILVEMLTWPDSGGRMCVGSHLAVYRKLRVLLPCPGARHRKMKHMGPPSTAPVGIHVA
ncbi:cytochrome P450 monooxygenase-like protein [Polyplosphaeria fusca]|uniref:Cytochrome P450 monooxygenase-like protein n=1 Tax=Polyplosphaeria fusca TaxID=682080 RepID=A0A9P4UYQ0_9PLEO|nr:cytochrome P450 monooxygenase-like protein [Polyplosphaeria fusca]